MRFCYNSPTKQAIYSKNRFSRKAGGGVLSRFGYKSSGKGKFIAFLQDFATRRPHYVPHRPPPKGVLWRPNMRFCYNSPTKQAIYSKNRFLRKAGGDILSRFGYKSSDKGKFIAFLQSFATRRPHYVPRRPPPRAFCGRRICVFAIIPAKNKQFIAKTGSHARPAETFLVVSAINQAARAIYSFSAEFCHPPSHNVPRRQPPRAFCDG